MSNVDWSKILIRASCTGKVLANAQGSVLTDKQLELLISLQEKEKRTDKQELELQSLIQKRDTPPKLGDTCISYLKEVYVWEKYGKEPIGGSERSKYTMKGRLVEDESIMMLSRIDNIQYEKNEDRFRNDFLSGTPDIILYNDEVPTKIIDIKSSYDFSTLLANEDSPLNPLYYSQMQSYMSLTGAQEAEVCYCLVNCPPEQLDAEKKRLYYVMNAVTEESPQYLREIERLENNFCFDEIPINERILRFPVKRDDAFIQKLHKRVLDCRIWLENYDKRRNFNNS